MTRFSSSPALKIPIFWCLSDNIYLPTKYYALYHKYLNICLLVLCNNRKELTLGGLDNELSWRDNERKMIQRYSEMYFSSILI